MLATKTKAKKRKSKKPKSQLKKGGKKELSAEFVAHIIKPGEIRNPNGAPTRQERVEKLFGNLARIEGFNRAEDLITEMLQHGYQLSKAATKGGDFAAICKIFMEYGYGKPKQTIEHTVPQPKDIILVDIDSLEEIKRLRGEIAELKAKLKGKGK